MTGQLGEIKVIYTQVEYAVAAAEWEDGARHTVAVKSHTNGPLCENKIQQNTQTDGERDKKE